MTSERKRASTPNCDMWTGPPSAGRSHRQNNQQDPDRLAYVLQGISNDGRFFVIVRADISHPDVQSFSPPRLKPGLPVSTYLKNEKDQSVRRVQLEKSLAAADTGSFVPSLSQLDQLIRSLKLNY